MFSKKHYESTMDALEQFKNDPLIAIPGSKFHYSSYGFNLLGGVIAAAAGEEYHVFLKRQVLDRLGLKDTCFDSPFPIIDNRARQYCRQDGCKGKTKAKDGVIVRDGIRLKQSPEPSTKVHQLINAPLTDNTNKLPSGGLLSTSRDLVVFASSFLIPHLRILDKETIDQLLSPAATVQGEKIRFGLGWLVGDSVTPSFSIDAGGANKDQSSAIIKEKMTTVVYHTGAAAGGSSVLLALPEEKICVAVLANLNNLELTNCALEIARSFIVEKENIKN